MIHLDLRSSQPLYEQIISQYKYLYLQGFLKKGDAIPSVRKLALELDVTPGTVAKAYREMEQSGMIETIRGKGTFMADIPSTARNEGVIRKMKTEIEKNCMELIYQGLGKEEIIALVEEAVDQLLAGKGEKMIEINGLYKSYTDEEEVVKDIHMKVEKGTIHGLIGHNGSGKTTIIKCVTGIYPPDRGEVLLGGEPVYENVKVKEKIGYVADSNQMFSNYKVQQLVKMYENIFEKFSREDFQALNRIFQVPLHHRISHLSKGQQMRTAFMLNLARNPEVMVLDEPTSGLDAMAKKELLDLLVTTVENREMTVLISSHHLSELEKICDNVTVIKNGRVYIDDELESVKNQIIKYQVVFTQGAPKELYERTDLLHLSNVGSVYTVVVPAEKEDFEQQMKQIGAVVVEEMPVGLEESFVYMNKAQKGGKVNAQV